MSMSSDWALDGWVPMNGSTEEEKAARRAADRLDCINGVPKKLATYSQWLDEIELSLSTHGAAPVAAHSPAVKKLSLMLDHRPQCEQCNAPAELLEQVSAQSKRFREVTTVLTREWLNQVDAAAGREEHARIDREYAASLLR